MLKAGTLFYSVVISLVIAVISGSVILLSGLSTTAFHHDLSAQELELNAASGLNLLLSKQAIVQEEEEQTIDLFGNGADSVLLIRKFWGAFEIAVSKAFRQGQSVLKVAETGAQPDSTDKYCLYIPDQDKPIAVCGETKIKGVAYLPKAGVKRAYIEGQNYSGSSLIYGEIKQSTRALPEFNKKLIERIKAFAESKSAENIENKASPGETAGAVKNSFLDQTLVITKNSAIVLNEIYSGNIAVISKTMVTITPDAVLNDIIICAPKVLIKEGFHGNLQVFASDSIIVEKNVSLDYPSVLGIVQNDNAANGSLIRLADNDTVSGNVFSYANTDAASRKPNGISFSAGSVVNGRVYSSGYADAKGKIFGSLMCRNVLLQTNSSVYENHFLNATIDRSGLSPYYTGISLVEESSLKGIVKWLD